MMYKQTLAYAAIEIINMIKQHINNTSAPNGDMNLKILEHRQFSFYVVNDFPHIVQ